MTFFLLYWKYIAAAAAIALLTVAYNVHVDGLIDDAVTAAVTENNGKWQDSEQKAIAKARTEAKAKEDAHAADLKTIGTQHAKELANAKLKHDKDVADAVSGALSLRIPAPACAGSGDLSGSPAAPAAGDAAATVELPRSLTSDLFSFANDADAVADQLTACQQVILSDRKEAASP